jgi:hypothetical protein
VQRIGRVLFAAVYLLPFGNPSFLSGVRVEFIGGYNPFVDRARLTRYEGVGGMIPTGLVQLRIAFDLIAVQPRRALSRSDI